MFNELLSCAVHLFLIGHVLPWEASEPVLPLVSTPKKKYMMHLIIHNFFVFVSEHYIMLLIKIHILLSKKDFPLFISSFQTEAGCTN